MKVVDVKHVRPAEMKSCHKNVLVYENMQIAVKENISFHLVCDLSTVICVKGIKKNNTYKFVEHFIAKFIK